MKTKKPIITNNENELNIIDFDYWFNKASKKRNFHSKYKCIFEFAPESIKNNKELVLLALKNYQTSLYCIEPKFTHDRNFLLEHIAMSSNVSFSGFPKEFQDDDELFFKALEKNHYNHKFLESSSKYHHRNYVKQILSTNHETIPYLAKKYKKDKEIIQHIIDLNPIYIEHFNKSITSIIFNDKKDSLNLLKQNPAAFPYIPLKFRNNIKFLTKYIEFNPLYISSLGSDVRNNLDFMSKYVSQYNFLDCLGNSLKSNEALMIAHLKIHPSNTYIISKELKNTDFYCKLIKESPSSYRYLYDEFQENPAIICSLFLHEKVYNNNNQEVFPYQILPKHIQKFLEYLFQSTFKTFYQTFNEINTFAKQQYLNIFLQKTLEKKSTVKKLKI